MVEIAISKCNSKFKSFFGSGRETFAGSLISILAHKPTGYLDCYTLMATEWSAALARRHRVYST